MELRQLEAFVSVAENGGFSSAARALFRTQPTISLHVASLEDELGVRLFERTPSGVTLTESGALLLSYARKMLALRDEAVSVIGETTEKGVISIAASSIPARYYLPELMAAFWKKHSGISFNVVEKDSSEVIRRVLSGQAELGMCGTKPTDERCRSLVIATDRLVIITPNTSRYQALTGGKYDPRWLLSESLIMREPGSGTRTETELFLRKHGVPPERLSITAELDSTEAIKQLVSGGAGVSVVSSSAASDYLSFGRLLAFEFSEENLERSLYLIYRKASPLSPSARLFLEFTRQNRQGFSSPARG